MATVLATLRRSLLVPAVLPLLFVAGAGAWLGTWLAAAALGGDAGFLDEVRQGALLCAGALTLSLAEPLLVGREVRGGLLALRVARGGGPALVGRWLGLVLATLPALVVATLAGGGLPPAPGALLVELLVLAAAGLALGSFLDRARLVPVLWVLLVASYLRPWLAADPRGVVLAWALPALGTLHGWTGVAHGLLWSAGALALAHWRLGRLVARGG